MSYTVIGLFPNQVEVDKVLSKLENAGYYDYSFSHSEEEILKNVDIRKKNGFWNWLFDDDIIELYHFEYAHTHYNTIKIDLKTEYDAYVVKNILNRNGAIAVEEKRTIPNLDEKKAQIFSEVAKAKIIAKAKNNLFFINNRKPHHIHQKRIPDEIDSLGTTKFY